MSNQEKSRRTSNVEIGNVTGTNNIQSFTEKNGQLDAFPTSGSNTGKNEQLDAFPTSKSNTGKNEQLDAFPSSKSNIEEKEQLDAFPTSISNRVTKTITSAAVTTKKFLRKRSSTESAVSYDSPKIQPRTRRYSKPFLDSVNPEKQNRLSKVIEKRHSRLSQHILKYIQLCIEINGTQSFIITIEKQKTVEDLIHQIEAEYAFQFLFPQKKNISDLKKDFSEPVLLTNQQFECNAVMNADGEIMKYSDIVGDVFDMFDTVVCTNVYEAKAPIRDNYGIYNNVFDASDVPDTFDVFNTPGMPDAEYENCKELSINNDNKSKESKSSKKTTIKKHRQNHEKIYSMIPNPTLDERFQSILHNKISLNMFYTFCLKEYSLENLLFWLDVEIYQTVNKDQYELYSKYIYYTYIDDKAPLQINITEEIKNDINVNNINYEDQSVLEIFDDAQEHIYIMLKIYLFQKFENNPIYAKLQDYKKKNRSEYEKNRILGFYGNYYKPDYDLLESKVNYLKIKKSENKDNEVNFNTGESYQTLYQDNWLSSALSQGVIINNNEELKNYMKTSERRIKEVKNMKLQKGKKLAKFFGEIVDVETLCQQVKKISKEEEEIKNDSTFDLTKKPEKKSLQNIKNEFDQEERKRLIRKNEKLNSVLGEALTEDQIKNIIDVDKRRKRMKYLQHFLYNQIDDKEIINEIRVEQEKAMADIRNERRSNKLKKYFGQAPPPDLINNKSDQMENRHRRSIISLTLLMSKENGIINLFNMINDIEKREEFFDCVDGNAKEDEEGSKYGDHLTVPKKLEKRDLTNLAIEEVAHDSEYELGNFPTNNTVYMNENIVIKVNDTTVKNENYKNNIKSENEGKNEEKEKNDDESDEIFYNTNSELLLDRKESSIEDQNERIYEIYENSNKL